MFKSFCELVVLFIPLVQCNEPTIRKTNNGPVQGIEQTTFFGNKYYAFRGIPYAEVPITGKDPYTGAEVDRRFKAPERLTRKWTRPLKAYDFGDNCIPGSSFFPIDGNFSENCLKLNIYVPDGGSAKKTVTVFLHGGAFIEGAGRDTFYGPDFLIDADNVVVTVNYRLGIFGFLNLGYGEYTGNMGLKDQQTALKWIYQNIENFSGKKDEILLFGESAGAASTNYHIQNEESRKYFSRAYLSSSSNLCYYAFDKSNHLERMQILLKIQNRDELTKYLKTVDGETIAKVVTGQLGSPLLEFPWVPTIESSETKGAFMTKIPEEVHKSGNTSAIDTMFSFNYQEFLLFNPTLINNTEPLISGNSEDSQILLPFDGFDKKTYPKEYKDALDLLKKAYYNGTDNVDVIKEQNIALLSDLNFVYGILKAAQYQVKANNKGKNKKNTFVFKFSVNGTFKASAPFNPGKPTHADDICYYFRCGIFNPVYESALKIRDTSNVDYNAIMRFVKMITNFARTGNPSIEGDTPFKSSKSANEIFAQDITNDLKTTLITDMMQKIHFDTWKKIDEIYNNLKKIA